MKIDKIIDLCLRFNFSELRQKQSHFWVITKAAEACTLFQAWITSPTKIYCLIQRTTRLLCNTSSSTSFWPSILTEILHLQLRKRSQLGNKKIIHGSNSRTFTKKPPKMYELPSYRFIWDAERVKLLRFIGYVRNFHLVR